MFTQFRQILPKQWCVRFVKKRPTSLRTFSRADRDYKVPFNIHEDIDSTILILKHRLKANEQRPTIEVVTNSGAEIFCADTLEKNPLAIIIAPNRGIIEAL
ncbi:hypothetical protein ACWATR_00080 [Nostoc sp. UIC 10890]|jgi:hypothetical protein